jgi:hypothetical protein
MLKSFNLAQNAATQCLLARCTLAWLLSFYTVTLVFPVCFYLMLTIYKNRGIWSLVLLRVCGAPIEMSSILTATHFLLSVWMGSYIVVCGLRFHYIDDIVYNILCLLVFYGNLIPV